MALTLMLARVTLWALFIVPICARLAIGAGDPLAAVVAAIVLGTLANLATSLPEE